MKKVLSLAISALFISNLSMANTTNMLNSDSNDSILMQTIKQKLDAKNSGNSGLGSSVQTSSGLSGIGSKPNKTTDNPVDKSADKPVVDSPVATSITSEPTNVVVNKPTSLSLQTNNELCAPKPVKKIVHRKIMKKPVSAVKENPDFDMTKSKDYVPVDFSEPAKFDNLLKTSQVKLTINGVDDNKINVNISDLNGNIIPADQFNKNSLQVIQIAENFEKLSNQNQVMNFKESSYLFNQEIKKCGVVFVQYQLKSSAEPTNLVKYINHDGEWTNQLDSECKVSLPNNLANSLDYYDENDLSGLFFNSQKIIAGKPILFHLIYNKLGITKIPNNLLVYAMKSDFSDLKVINLKSVGNAVTGTNFETILENGNYIFGYSFNEGKPNNYYRNVNVSAE